MAKVNGREDALLQAYLSRYKASQDSAVTGGQKNTQKAQRQGSAILNATDKTLPSLGNPYESTLKNIVSGVSTENSLNLDFMNRQVKLAKAQYDAAQDYAKQMEKAQSYAAKAAAKATKRRTGKGNTAGQNTSTDLSDTAANALNGLNSSGTNTKANSTKPSNNAANRKKKPSAQEQYLADKASGKRKAIPSNSYAERSNAAQPAQSRAVTKGGKVIGSSYATAGSAQRASERTAAKQRQERVADSLQKLQTDASYRAELAAPGRKLDSAEVEAVNQYVKNTKNTGFRGLKRVIDLAKNSDNLSKEEYAKKSAALNAELNQNSALRAKAQGNGAGQSAQAFTAGLYDSVPFLSKASDAMASAANATGLGSELPMLTKTLEDTKTYDPVAATLGTMAGKAMQYNLFNTLAAGTKYGKAAQAVGGKIGAAAQKIPGLGALVGDGFGDAAGRVLADTGADLVLDTLPSLASDVSEGKSAGEVAGNAAKNLVGNVAMNALPEIGGAVFNKIKGAAGDAAQDAAQVANTQEIPAFNLYTVPADDTLDYTKVIQDVSADAQRTAAQRTRAQELQELLAQQAEQDKAAYVAKQAAGNSADLPIDGATGAVYNKANGGVLDENLGGVLPGDVSLGINHLPGAESESGDVLDFVSGQYGAAGSGNAAQNIAAGAGTDGTGTVQSLEEWAKGLTGKDRRSPVTRGVEDIQRRLQAGESYDTLKRDADSLALSIVGDGVFGEPMEADETTLLLKEYFGKTEIHVGEAEKNEILRKTGLKNLQQFNYQNGTRLTTKPANENFDTALQQLADMGVRVDGAMENGNQLDPFLDAIEKTKPQPLAMSAEEAALNSAYTEYISEHILRGVSAGEASNQGFEAWLLRQNLTDESPDYMRTAKDWALDGVARNQQLDLDSLEDNFFLQNNAPYYDGKDLNDILPQNGVLDSDVSDSFAREHLNAAKAVRGAEVPKESPYYDDWLRTQGALRQEQTLADLSGEAADMQKAANRLDALNAQNEALLRQNDIWQAEQNQRMARQQALDEIQARYEDAVNRVPVLDNLTDTSGWQTQQGAYFDGGVPYLTKDTAMPDAAKSAAQSLPLNGSESVPEHAVGAASTQYDRREVLNQDYANQRRFNADLEPDEVAALGADQNTHTLYSRKESADNARLSFDTYRQSSDGSISAATDNVLKDLRNLDKWNADDLALAKEAQNQQRNLLLKLEKGSPEYEVEFAKYKQLDRQTSRGFSEAGRALQEGVNAEQTADTGLRKFNQLTQKITSEYADSRKGKQLREISNVVYDGKVDEILTQIAKEQGVEEAMLQAEKQIRKAAESKHIKLNDDEIKKAAASMVAGGNADDMFDALARTQLKIGDFTEADNDRIREIFTQTSGMKDSKARYQLESEAYGIMSKYLPAKSFWDKWNNLRYLSMLGNTRTHARNILGNVSMNAVVRTKDNVSAVMQLAIPQEERTKAIGTTFTKQGRELIDGAKKYIDTDAYSLLYNDGKYNVQTGLASAQKTYGNSPFGKLLQWASDKNSGLLEKEDAFFLREAYANSMASFLKARGYDASVFRADDAASKEILRKASAQALEDAKEATFHEDNILSTALKNFSKDTNKSGVVGKLSYAITEGILPFKKTPINIAKNALEYSGGGLVEAGYRAIKGESKARVIDAAAKGITGLGAIGIGYALSKTGILNGGGSGDDRVDAYNEMTGRQDYSVTLPNGATYTIDWTSPAAIPLMIGAELSEDNSGLTVAGFFEKLSRFTNPILETTMLQGLNDTLQNLKYSDNPIWDLGANSVSSYFGQSVPTLLGQISRTMDDTRRSTYGGGQTKPERDNSYALNKMASRIPGLSQSLEPYIDQWGREQASLDGTDDSAGGMFLRGAYNMLSPGYIRQENITPVDEYLQGLYGSTNDSGVFPEKASNSVTVDSKTYYLTPEEKTQYAKTRGQISYDAVDSLRQNSMFLQLPEDQQNEIVKDVYTVAGTAAAADTLGDGVSGTNTKAYKAYEQGGIPMLENYLLADSAIKDAGATKQADVARELLNSGLDSEGIYNSYILKYPKDQKAPAVYSQYGADGAKNWLRYQASADMDGNGRISQDEARAVLDAMNLTDAQRAYYYLLTNSGWSAKNNPYGGA